MKNKIIIIIIAIFLIAGQVLAVNTNTLYPYYSENNLIKSYIVNELNEFKFIIKNEENIKRDIIIEREILTGMGEVILEKQGWTKKPDEDPTLNTLNKFEYLTSINPSEELEFTLKSKFTMIPSNGKLEIPIIKILDAETKKVISTTYPKTIEIKCKIDSYCDLSIHENFKNCQHCKISKI